MRLDRRGASVFNRPHQQARLSRRGLNHPQPFVLSLSKDFFFSLSGKKGGGFDKLSPNG